MMWYTQRIPIITKAIQTTQSVSIAMCSKLSLNLSVLDASFSKERFLI